MATSIRTEIIAGVTTFFTMAYIVVVNPSILSTEGTGLAFSGVLTATVFICFVATLLMGLYARLPFAVAPGMGLNAFVTFSIILGNKVPWPIAFGLVFWVGVVFVLISATRVREAIARAIPMGLRSATAAGIGLFITFIGLRNAGVVQADAVTFVAPGTLDHRAALTLMGLAVAAVLARRESPLAFLGSIASVTGVAWALGYIVTPDSFVSWPDFSSVFLKLDVVGALDLALVPVMVSVLFTNLFDALSTFIGVAQAANLTDEKGDPKNLREGLIVDAFSGVLSGLAGSSPGTAYVESIAGIKAGGRTGLTAVVTACCFLPCFFIAPLAAAVPPYATASVLLLVGLAMFHTVKTLPLDHIEDALPAFLTVVLIPLTFSITQGILWGLVSHVGLYLLVGRGREVKPVMYALGIAAAGLLALEHGAWR